MTLTTWCWLSRDEWERSCIAEDYPPVQEGCAVLVVRVSGPLNAVVICQQFALDECAHCAYREVEDSMVFEARELCSGLPAHRQQNTSVGLARHGETVGVVMGRQMVGAPT